MIEVTVTGRGHLHGWLLCEARRDGLLLLKLCAPARLVDAVMRALDNNYVAKSLIALADSDAAWLFSGAEGKQ